MIATSLSADKIQQEEIKVALPIVIGSDNAGYQLKAVVEDYFEENGIPYIDVNPEEGTAKDYPNSSRLAAEQIRNGNANTGILICGTGIGIGVAAAKFPGVYPVRCDDAEQARIARMVTGANMLTFGQRTTGYGLALDIVRAFLTTGYDEENGAFDLVKTQEAKYFGGTK